MLNFANNKNSSLYVRSASYICFYELIRITIILLIKRPVMKHYPSFTKVVFTLALTVVMISVFAFRQNHKSGGYSFRKEQFSNDEDTFHKRSRNGANRDFYKINEQMRQLDLQMEKLYEQIKNMDMRKYQEEIDNAVKNIDQEKISAEIDKSLKNIDWERMNKEITENTAELSKLKLDEVKKQLEKVKLNLQKQKFDIQLNGQKMKLDIERAMKQARQSLENAKDEIKNVKEFTDALEKDGLIHKSKAYKIEVKNGELYIDGKKQSKETSDKYRHYYRKSDFTIDMSAGDNFWI